MIGRSGALKVEAHRSDIQGERVDLCEGVTVSAAVMRQIHRIRKYQEQDTRVAWLSAEQERQNREASLDQTQRQINASRDNAAGDVEALVRHHAYALRMEMVRRRQAEQVRDQQRTVDFHQDRWRHANREAKVVERIAETREESMRWAEQQLEQRRLDECGMQGWWRSNR